jgi:uncharacterized protein YdaT
VKTMSNYYKELREATALIKDLLTEGRALPIICYKVKMKFGFGKKFVEKTIEELKEFNTAIGIEQKTNEKDEFSSKKDRFSEENDLNSEEKAIFSSVETVAE